MHHGLMGMDAPVGQNHWGGIALFGIAHFRQHINYRTYTPNAETVIVRETTIINFTRRLLRI